ncbi:hypothetical protein HWV62_27188, partial [Athelia sp. TMB]
MKAQFPCFSLKRLLTSIFHENASTQLKVFSISFQKDDGTVKLMEMLYRMRGIKDQAVCNWVVRKVGDICANEAAKLTGLASGGGLAEEAGFFRVHSKKITGHATSEICSGKAVIGKNGVILGKGVRDPDM